MATTTTQPPPTPAHELVYTENALPLLRSNHGPHLPASAVTWMQETPLDTPLPEMRRRFATSGYLFLKSALPRSDVLDVREEYFAHLAPTGILKPGTSPRDGIFNEGEDPETHSGVGGTDLPEDVRRVRKLEEAHRLPVYLKFLEHEGLRGFVRRFMGWEREVLLKRTMLRHNVPNGLSTGIHYDKIFLRAGEAEFLTAWVPIGDCTPAGGGLMYLEHSDDIGLALESSFTDRARTFTPAERISGFNQNMARDGQLSHNVAAFDASLRSPGTPYGILPAAEMHSKSRKWLVGNYEAGDIVFHNPYLIHGAVKNEDPLGRIRLSTDLRFYEVGEGKDERWMRFWAPKDGL